MQCLTKGLSLFFRVPVYKERYQKDQKLGISVTLW